MAKWTNARFPYQSTRRAAVAVGNSVRASTNPMVNGLVQGGRWVYDANYRVISYAFQNSSLGTWDNSWRSTITTALQSWSKVANFSFINLPASPIPFASTADLTFNLTNDRLTTQIGSVAMAIFPDPYQTTPALDLLSAALGRPLNDNNYHRAEGDVFIDQNYGGFQFNNPGGYGLATIIHEIGHSLGLKHPHDDGGNNRPTFNELGIGGYDDGLWTVMSYNAPPASSIASGNQATPMPLDILAIQHIYGANSTTNRGPTTYTLVDNEAVATIWDAGGTDCLDASSLGQGVEMDLREGGFSRISETTLVAIAFNVTMENGIGSNFDDVVFGNSVANTIRGRGGNDTLFGNGGNDVLDGGAGDDRLIGGTGLDRLMGGEGADLFTFPEPNQGRDLLVDFQTGIDKIDLAWEAEGPFAGYSGENFFSAADGRPQTSEHHFLYNQTSRVFSFDADGSGLAGAVALFSLGTGRSLVVSDILFAAG